MTLLAGQLSTLHDPHSDLGKPAKAAVWPGSPFPYPMKLYGGLEYAILLIMAAVAMVLVIACANVASLQLARAASRQSELGMRLSLGASRMRIIRQLLTESALLGLIAGAVALLFSWAFLQVVVVLIADAFPAEYGTFIFHVTPDLGIFAYVFCVSLLAGVLFGLAPALESSGAAVSSALKANSGTGKVRSRRMRNFLMAAQVAVSLMLLIAGSMLTRSSIRALKMDTGYDTERVVSLALRFPEGQKYSADRQTTLVRELRTRLAALPGVAAITSARAPDGGGLRTAAVSLNGETPYWVSGMAIAACTSPTLPGQSGKIVATFISTSTSPAAAIGWSMWNACIAAQTANSWQIQPRNWNEAAVSAATRRRMIASPWRAADEQRAHASELVERSRCCGAARAPGDDEQREPDAEHDAIEARDRPVRDLRGEQHPHDEHDDGEEVEHAVREDRPDERRPGPPRPGSRRASTATRASSPTRPGSTTFANRPDRERREHERNRGCGGGDRLLDRRVPGERAHDDREQVERDRGATHHQRTAGERVARRCQFGPRHQMTATRRARAAAPGRADAPAARRTLHAATRS